MCWVGCLAKVADWVTTADDDSTKTRTRTYMAHRKWEIGRGLYVDMNNWFAARVSQPRAWPREATKAGLGKASRLAMRSVTMKKIRRQLFQVSAVEAHHPPCLAWSEVGPAVGLTYERHTSLVLQMHWSLTNWRCSWRRPKQFTFHYSWGVWSPDLHNFHVLIIIKFIVYKLILQ